MCGDFLLSKTFHLRADIAKVHEGLGLVFGYALICTEDGEPYFDLQGDHVPEDAMLKSSLDFVEHSRFAGEMHMRDDEGKLAKRGTVSFLFPLTADIAKSLGLSTRKTGMLIAIRPDADVLAKFRSGELTGFSIGGARIQDEELADAT